MFWLSLGLKLVLTAGIVVSASVVVERAGPLIGALVVTLPVTVWPAYVFLSLDHDANYLAASAQSGTTPAIRAAPTVRLIHSMSSAFLPRAGRPRDPGLPAHQRLDPLLLGLEEIQVHGSLDQFGREAEPGGS